MSVRTRIGLEGPLDSPRARLLLLGASVLLGLALTVYSTLQVAALALAAWAAVLVFLWPEVGTLLGVFALYSNLTVLAFQLHGAPRAFAISFLVLFGMPLIYHVFYRRRPVIVDRTLQLMLVFLLVVLVSSVFAKDPALAYEWIGIYLTQGVITFFLVINAIRSRATLERVLLVLVATGALLGAMSLYQEISNDYRASFLGLAQRNLDHVENPSEFSRTPVDHVRLSHRAGGPIREANYYAQMLLVLLPFALLRIREQRGLGRTIAVVLALGILAGIFLSYSRGGFLGLLVVTFLAVRWKLLSRRTVAAGAAAGLLLVALAVPGYFMRIGSLRALSGLAAPTAELEPDGALTGRATEMLAALAVFVDHPVLGVGPAHYSPYYSVEYQTSGTAFTLLDKTRRAHSLYFEMAAELGLIGLGVFLTMVGMLLVSLLRLRRLLSVSHPSLARLATAAAVALIGCLSTSFFLQLAYQRYFWFLVAIAATVEQITRRASREPVAAPTAQRRIVADLRGALPAAARVRLPGSPESLQPRA